MKDDLYESTAAPQNLKAQKAFYAFYNVLFTICCVAAFLIVFLIFSIDIQAIPALLVLLSLVVVFAVICYVIRRKLLLYFDYTYISGEVRIIRVINGKTRRKFLIVQCKDIYKLGKVGSGTFEKLRATPGIKRKIATPNGMGAQNQLYYLAAKCTGENTLIILECEEELLSYIVNYSGRSIIEEDYDKN